MTMMLELYPPILREIVELRLDKKLRIMSSITNDEMDLLREQLREEVLMEQRYWNDRRAKNGTTSTSEDNSPETPHGLCFGEKCRHWETI